MEQPEWKDKNKDKDIVLYQPNNGLNKPSKLIRTMYSNSLTSKQKHTYNFFLRELLITKKSELIIDKNLGSNEISFKLKDLQNHLGIKKYHDLEKDLTKLQTTLIKIFEEDSYTQATLLSSFTLPKENNELNEVVIRFDTRYTKVLHNIPAYIFLPYKELEKLKNTHSITYYEMFKRQLNKYEHTISIKFTEEELRALLNIDKKQYPTPNKFKLWCVDKPLEQINAYTSVSVSYERIKVSKGVYSFKFNASQSLELTFNQFVNKFKKYCMDKDITFSYKKKKYYYSEHFENNNVSILLTDLNIEENKNVKSKTQYKNNETLNKNEAEEIHYFIYDNFIDNNITFMYSLIFNKNIDSSLIELMDIETKDMDIVLEELEHFKRGK